MIVNRHTRRLERLFYCLISVLVAFALPVRAAEPNRTIVSDTVYRADGSVAKGTLLISWGQSQLARDAQNYFGIKAHGHHDSIALPTFECVNGRTVRVTAEFARYYSMEECFADHDRLVLSLACYAEARAAKDDPEAFARALARHWATDPKYAEKLISVYRANRLDELGATA